MNNAKIFGSSMGVLTIEQCGEDWFVYEDGRRVGGTLLYPFESREAAQRWLDRSLADEATTMRDGDPEEIVWYSKGIN